MAAAMIVKTVKPKLWLSSSSYHSVQLAFANSKWAIATMMKVIVNSMPKMNKAPSLKIAKQTEKMMRPA